MADSKEKQWDKCPNLPTKGYFFPTGKVGLIADIMSGDCPACGGEKCQRKLRFHKFRMGRKISLYPHARNKPIDVYFFSGNEDAADILRDEKKFSLANYDDALDFGGLGARFFITDDNIEDQWDVFSEALELAPKLSRKIPDKNSDVKLYDIIGEHAELAVNEAIHEILKNDEGRGEVNLVTDYAYTATHIFVRDFLGLETPGKTLKKKANKLVNWIFFMFGNLFANPGNRMFPLGLYSSHISRKYVKAILKSYENPKPGSLLARLKKIEQKKRAEAEIDNKEFSQRDFEKIVINIIMEVAGSFQYLTGTSFGKILKSIEEKIGDPELGISHTQLRAFVKQVKDEPKLEINELLRLNSPTMFMLRTVRETFKFEGEEFKKGSLICTLNGKANLQESCPVNTRISEQNFEGECPYHLHFGGPDAELPSEGKPVNAHPCFGQYWAQRIIEKMLEGLLHFKNLRIEQPGTYKEKAGKPVRFIAQYDLEAENQQFVTILSQLKTEHPEAVLKAIEAWKNPAEPRPKSYEEYKTLLEENPEDAPAYPSINTKLQNCESIHFMSAHVVLGGENEKSMLRRVRERLKLTPKDRPLTREPDYLLIELNIDGNLQTAIDELSLYFKDELVDLYVKAGLLPENASDIKLQKRLFRDAVALEQSMWPTLFNGKTAIGLPFTGTEGLNCQRIIAENEIATQVDNIVNEKQLEYKSHHARLYEIRGHLFDQGDVKSLSNRWVFGGSHSPVFSETLNDPWVGDGNEKPGIMQTLGLVPKLLPRVLILPVLFLFLFIAAMLEFNATGEKQLEGLFRVSAGTMAGYLLVSGVLTMILGLAARWSGRQLLGAMGEMFLIALLFSACLILFDPAYLFCQSQWNQANLGLGLSCENTSNFDLFNHPGNGFVQGGTGLFITVAALTAIFTIGAYFGFRKTRRLVDINPWVKSFGAFILFSLIALIAYIHIGWMFAGDIGGGSYIVQNRFPNVDLMDLIFYPAVFAAVITLTLHSFEKSFNNPNSEITSKKNFHIFGWSWLLIAISAFFPMSQDWFGGFGFVLFQVVLFPLFITLCLMIAFQLFNSATSTRSTGGNGLRFTILIWVLMISLLINLNADVRNAVFAFLSPIIHDYVSPFIKQVSFGTLDIGFSAPGDFLTSKNQGAIDKTAEIIKAIVIALPVTLFTLFLLVFGLKSALNSSERRNTPHDSDPDIKNVDALMCNENATDYDQNHMISVQRLLPEWYRQRFLLPLSFQVIKRMLVAGFIRPGFLGSVGTVHFARWVQFPRTRNYAFVSNYDGSFESYLEDFVTKVNSGLNAAWSHCVGYPKVENIFMKGSEDGDRFIRWARGSTRPTPFWYSAYPDLTVETIRRNALIRDGLVRARSGSEAEAWFDLFDSTTRPEHALQTDQIQNFVFGAAKNLPFASCLVIYSDKEEPDLKSFVKEIEDDITFGQAIPEVKATYFALTRKGLESLGVGKTSETDESRFDAHEWRGDQRVLDTDIDPTWFSSPFGLGMDHPSRANILADTDDNAPGKWEWGNSDEMLAVVLIYSKTKSAHMQSCADVEGAAVDAELLVHSIPLKEIEGGKHANKEPFGFADGISNPIIKGTRGYLKNPSSIHIVEPGEIIMGYRDNRGYFPPSPQVETSSDIHRLLPAIPNEQPQKYPTFDGKRDDRLRDLGRNGSYLVIRQLEQDREAFHNKSAKAADKFLERLEEKSKRPKGFKPGVFKKKLQPIIEAKMVGRWQDGQSLISRPIVLSDISMDMDRNWQIEPNPENLDDGDFLAKDNEFLLGRDDPQGYACPFGSHVRRSNPRESLDPNSKDELSVSNRHRILRRGRSYDYVDEDKNRREGTFFMCLNVDLDRQFEFIQQSWMNGRNFHGLRNENDPLANKYSDEFTVQCPGSNFQFDVTEFIQMKGGGYFFMPGKEALTYMLEILTPIDSSDDVNSARQNSGYGMYKIANEQGFRGFGENASTQDSNETGSNGND